MQLPSADAGYKIITGTPTKKLYILIVLHDIFELQLTMHWTLREKNKSDEI